MMAWCTDMLNHSALNGGGFDLSMLRSTQSWMIYPCNSDIVLTIWKGAGAQCKRLAVDRIIG